MRRFLLLVGLLLLSFGARGSKDQGSTVVVSPSFWGRDDSRIVQRALDRRPRTLVFRQGVYSFKDVEIRDDVDIVAEGRVVFRPMPVQRALWRTGLNMCNSMLVARDVDSIGIRGIHFVGRTTGNLIEEGFKSSEFYSRPIISVDRARSVDIQGCVFRDIEGCTYCNEEYTYYGNKKGLLICLYDVDDVRIRDNEITGCRHDEQIWSIAVTKQKEDMSVRFSGNYIHDEYPAVNSSAFTCVAGRAYLTDNRVERFNYKGSIFNLFADVVHVEDNTISDSYATSVFDTGEYGYFWADSVFVRRNTVSVKNSEMLATMARHIELTDNTFAGVCILVSENQSVASRSSYTYFYQMESPRQANDRVIIERNKCDFTLYDPSLSLLLPEKYGYGIYISPYYNVGDQVLIKDNEFSSFSAGKDTEIGFACNTIKIVNMKNITVEDNTIRGAWYHAGSSVYTTPIVIEMERHTLTGRQAADEAYTSIGSIRVTGNAFEPNAQNSTVFSVNRYLMDGVLRLGEIQVEHNDGAIGAPMLYNSFTEKLRYDNPRKLSVRIPSRTISEARAVGAIKAGERLETGTVVRLSDNTVWQSTNVVGSYKDMGQKPQYLKPDEMLYQGVYWIKISDR